MKKIVLVASLIFVTLLIVLHHSRKTNEGKLYSSNNPNTQILNVINAMNIKFSGNVKRVKIGVIDTPYDKSQPNLSHIVTVNENKQITIENLEHGTMVLGLLASIPTKMLEYSGLINNSEVYHFPVYTMTANELANCINLAVEKKIDVLNISLGTYEDTLLLKEAIHNALNTGMVIVASAGNDSTETELNYPASYDGVISVGSIDQNYNLLDSTNYNNKIDVFAPGWNIRTLSDKNHGYITNNFSGTSASTVLVTALIVLMKADNHNLNSTEIEYILKRSSNHYTAKWKGKEVPVALIDFNKSLNVNK
jgi:subtilisin family serine protease